MGFDLDLFTREIPQTLICIMCESVVDDPMTTPCGHVSCPSCVIVSDTVERLDVTCPECDHVTYLRASHWPRCGGHVADLDRSWPRDVTEAPDAEESRRNDESLRRVVAPSREQVSMATGHEVNGKDLSNAGHDKAAQAFQTASEPITVVLKRTNHGGVTSLPETASQSDMTSLPECFCQFLIESCRNNASPASSLILSELMRFESMKRCEDNSAFEDEEFEYEEVVLRRTAKDKKLGIMLSDQFDSLDRVRVVVSQISRDSLAERSGRIHEGDHIVKINGYDVTSMNDATSLLNKENNRVTFLVARHCHAERQWNEESECSFRDSNPDAILCDVTNQNNADRDSETGTEKVKRAKSSDDSATKIDDVTDKRSDAAHSLAREFTFVKPSNYPGKAATTASPPRSDLQRLSEAIDDLELSPPDVSPWVRIARQDYHDKVRDARSLHPALCDVMGDDVMAAMTSHSNTSSAYSTGESFRSCSSRGDDRVKFGSTMSCYVSSDANSDDGGCDVTHRDSQSEGFEDAGSEFASPGNPPTPKPRILFPRNDLVTSQLTTSTRQLFSAAAAVVKSRRLATSQCIEEEVPIDNGYGKPRESPPSVTSQRKIRRATSVQPDDVIASNRPPVAQRSFSFTEGQDDVTPMEWRVKVRADGSRYVTKRPVRREKALKEREERILKERCSMTTDDDVTEMKLGRHWSRDERKRQLRHAREKKRRRDFMQRCRLEVVSEGATSDNVAVELGQKKLASGRRRRMLLDDFVTVQELLAHGDRSGGTDPLVSVTYI